MHTDQSKVSYLSVCAVVQFSNACCVCLCVCRAEWPFKTREHLHVELENDDMLIFRAQPRGGNELVCMGLCVYVFLCVYVWLLSVTFMSGEWEIRS